MPRNPRGYDRRDDIRQREIFGPEGREWRRVKNRTEQDQLVESSCPLPITAKKNRDQTDGKNHSRGLRRESRLPTNSVCRRSRRFLSTPLHLRNQEVLGSPPAVERPSSDGFYYSSGASLQRLDVNTAAATRLITIRGVYRMSCSASCLNAIVVSTNLCPSSTLSPFNSPRSDRHDK
jgi:hypothetical protein